jgi:serine/threonine protein kinase
MAGTSAPPIPDCRDLAPIGERLASTLYRAQSDRLGRRVTVTVFPPLSDEAARRRFDNAAATARRLAAHPSVLTVHDWGQADDGRPWVVTDPQPAETVDTVLKSSGPLPVDQALRIGVLVAGALETAHRAGIVHGDLSPDRLVFGPTGEPLVADIGLAEFSNFPGFGALHNPIRYFAPPEVLERTGVTAASDIYSLASTVYAFLAGRAPHEKPPDITDSNASLLLRILQIEVPPIVRPDVPPGLERPLHAALAHAPEKRPLRALDLAWSLQDVQRTAGLAVAEPVVLDLGGADAQPASPPLTQPATPPAGGPQAAPPLPPELDSLPSWYTDPLPNGPAVPEADLVYLFSETPPDLIDPTPGPVPQHWASGLGHLSAPAAPPGEHDRHDADEPEEPAADADGHWPAPPNGHRTNGHGLRRPGDPTTGSPAPWGFEHPQSPRPDGLNGSGHNGRRSAPHVGLDEDLGPVQRPPIDVAKLGHALGPTPPRPRPTSADGPLAPPPGAPGPVDPDTLPAARHTPGAPSTRLPRSHETEQAADAGTSPVPPGTRSHTGSGSPGTGAFIAAGPTRLGSPLDRARQARDTSRLAPSHGVAPAPSLAASEPQPPRVPAPGPGAAPALPVIVLIIVVVLLTLGVAYMVITDNGASEPTDGQPGAAPRVEASVQIDQA